MDRPEQIRDAIGIAAALHSVEEAISNLRKLVGRSDEAANLSFLFALESVQHARKSLARGIERLKESDDPRVPVPSERQPDASYHVYSTDEELDPPQPDEEPSSARRCAGG